MIKVIKTHQEFETYNLPWVNLTMSIFDGNIISVAKRYQNIFFNKNRPDDYSLQTEDGRVYNFTDD